MTLIKLINTDQIFVNQPNLRYQRSVLLVHNLHPLPIHTCGDTVIVHRLTIRARQKEPAQVRSIQLYIISAGLICCDIEIGVHPVITDILVG